METFAPAQYGSAWAELLSTDRCRPLGAGTPDPAFKRKLESASLAQLFSPRDVNDEQMAKLCVAGAWLLGDDLDASHTISQQFETPSGSFWHGIMHRREGDFSNAKYWFRRVGEHPVFDALGPVARGLATAAEASFAREKILSAASWNPYTFIDLCSRCAENRSAGGADAQLCRQLAQAEWELLFDACYRAAVA